MKKMLVIILTEFIRAAVARTVLVISVIVVDVDKVRIVGKIVAAAVGAEQTGHGL